MTVETVEAITESLSKFYKSMKIVHKAWDSENYFPETTVAMVLLQNIQHYSPDCENHDHNKTVEKIELKSDAIKELAKVYDNDSFIQMIAEQVSNTISAYSQDDW